MQDALTAFSQTAFFVWASLAGLVLGGVGLVIALSSISDSLEKYRALYRASTIDTILARAVWISYWIPRKIFGEKLWSFRAVGMSVFSSVIVFVIFLCIAYLTTRIDPATGLNPVIDYINTFKLNGITAAIAGDEGNRKFAERWFGNLLYTATAISIVSALVFECLCLTKSRALMRRVHPDSKAIDISKLMLSDLLSTLISYVVFYTFIWFLCTIIAEILFDVKPISPMLTKRLSEEGGGR